MAKALMPHEVAWEALFGPVWGPMGVAPAVDPDRERCADVGRHLDLVSPGLLDRGLMNSTILWVFVKGPMMSGGGPCCGKVQLLSRASMHLLSMCGAREIPDIVITLSWFQWFCATTDAQRVAILDHELRHCGWDEEGEALVYVPHDAEVFAGEIERHGAWRPAIRHLCQVAQGVQLDLELGGESVDPETGVIGEVSDLSEPRLHRGLQRQTPLDRGNGYAERTEIVGALDEVARRGAEAVKRVGKKAAKAG